MAAGTISSPFGTLTGGAAAPGTAVGDTEGARVPGVAGLPVIGGTVGWAVLAKGETAPFVPAAAGGTLGGATVVAGAKFVEAALTSWVPVPTVETVTAVFSTVGVTLVAGPAVVACVA